MAEIGEEVAMMQAHMKKEPLCRGKEEPENRGWKCRVGKSGSPGDLDAPTPERLNANMKTARVFLPADPPRSGDWWDLDKCSPAAHPYQSHHLIPKMHLPTHDVCVWLAKNAADGQWALTESTDYDADDARNGMALPFASTTQQWKKATNAVTKEEICRTMMKLTGKQLHQGSHTYEDYGEEDELHAKEEPGYLGAVDELLKVIHGEVLLHVRLCVACKKSDSKPRKVRPLERAAAGVHQASSLMKSIITQNKRFVSLRAAAYFGSGGNL